MSTSGTMECRERASASFRRIDWVVLPLVGLLTIVILSAGTELIARRVFYTSPQILARCLVLNDPATGVRGIPNCVVRTKAAEGPWFEYALNSCGHRAGMECGPKIPGHFRIVQIGSSMAMGELVPREQTFAALLPVQLSRDTGRTVELYNEAMGFGFSHSTSLRFRQALSEQPDMILWPIVSTDIYNSEFVLPAQSLDPWPNLGLFGKFWKRLQLDKRTMSTQEIASELFGRTRTALMLRHFLYKSNSQYIKSVLASQDNERGFLKTSLSPFWQQQLRQFDHDCAQMEAEAHAAGVPFVATYIPGHADAALISQGAWPAGYDPYNLRNHVRSIVESHGGTYVDILSYYGSIPYTERGYFPVDGHLNATGHALIASLLDKALTDGAIPQLRTASSDSGRGAN